MEQVQRSEKKSVTWTFTLVLLAVFALYAAKIFKKLPCDETLVQTLESNLVHVSFMHIAVNLWTFWSLSDIETRIGSGKYLGLILSILGVSSVAELLINKARKNNKCSIGFSGVIYGLFAWDLVTKKGKFDWKSISGLAAMIILNSMTVQNTSFQGHLVGAVTGLGLGLLNNGSKNKISNY